MTDNNIRLYHFLLTAAAVAVCLKFSIPCAVTVLIFSLLLLGIYQKLLSKRHDTIIELCDDIDRILRNDDLISFDEYKEGELSILSAEIHKMTIRLREQNSALAEEKKFAKEALEDISHQLRTPLTSVMMILGLMRDPQISKEQRTEYIWELCELLDRMKWLIETMLSLSRIEADAVKFAEDSVSCRELIKHSADAVSVTAELKGVELKTIISGEPSFIGDIRYTSEALVNLLKNAIEHTPEGGNVTIRAEGNNISTNITISDTGEGIPESELPHIFKRFYRSSEYTKNGFGIGLAFAKNVITSQNGSLKASNSEPNGAVFDIRFYRTVV